MVYKVERNNREILASLFKNDKNPHILSALQGYMGDAWVDNLESPTVAMITISIFVYFAGDSSCNVARELLLELPKKRLIIPESEQWEILLKTVLKGSIKKHQRHTFVQNVNNFDIIKLEKMTKALPEGYTIKRIDKQLATDPNLIELPIDYAEPFDSVDDFLNRGIGFWALHNNQVVCGATSGAIYSKGFEIDIETHINHKGKGLATAIAATFILYCLNIGLYPAWEAANEISVKLAEKLGYVYEASFDCYWKT